MLLQTHNLQGGVWGDSFAHKQAALARWRWGIAGQRSSHCSALLETKHCSLWDLQREIGKEWDSQLGKAALNVRVEQQ